MIVKCLQFDLPFGIGGTTQQLKRQLILKRLANFSQQYGVKYKHFVTEENIFDQKLNIYFTEDSNYTLFVLLKDFNSEFGEYKILDIEVFDDSDV